MLPLSSITESKIFSSGQTELKEFVGIQKRDNFIYQPLQGAGICVEHANQSAAGGVLEG